MLLGSCSKSVEDLIADANLPLVIAGGEFDTCEECCSAYADTWKKFCPGCGCTRKIMDDIDNGGVCFVITVARAKASNPTGFVNPFELTRRKLIADDSPVSLDILNFYDIHSARVQYLVLHDASLMQSSYNLMISLTPYFLDFANNANNSGNIITASLVLEINNFISSIIAANGSQGSLATDLNFMLNKLNLNSLVGLTATQAWAAIKTSY